MSAQDGVEHSDVGNVGTVNSLSQSLMQVFKDIISEWAFIPKEQLSMQRSHGASMLRTGGARPIPSTKILTSSSKSMNSSKRIGNQSREFIRLRPNDDDIATEIKDIIQYDIPEKPQWSQDAEKFIQMIEQRRNHDQSLPDTNTIFAYFHDLRLVDQNIGHIDSASRQLCNLTELCLNVNCLKFIDANHLPVSLEILNAYGNEITQVPDASSLPKLVHLGLGFNRIQSISPSIGERLSTLLSLDLSYNELDDIQATLDAISSIMRLRHLALIGNPFSFAPEYRGFVVDSLPWILVLDDIPISEKEREKVSGDRNKDISKALYLTIELNYVKKLREPKGLSKASSASPIPGSASDDGSETRVSVIHGEVTIPGMDVQKTLQKQIMGEKVWLDYKYTVPINLDRKLSHLFKGSFTVRFFETTMIQRPASTSKKEKKGAEKPGKAPAKVEEKPPTANSKSAAAASKDKEKIEKGKDGKPIPKKEVKVKLEPEEPPQTPSPVPGEAGEDLLSVVDIGWAQVPLDEFLNPAVCVTDNQYCVEFTSLQEFENLQQLIAKERVKQLNESRFKPSKSKKDDPSSITHLALTKLGRDISKHQPILRARVMISPNPQATLPPLDPNDPLS